jgi:hypothetical protein
MRNDIKLAAHLDALGYDEFWVGEHHSTGWETIASPELFLAAAGGEHATGSGWHRAWCRCRITTRSPSHSGSCSSTT